jgi:hypothetical protein
MTGRGTKIIGRALSLALACLVLKTAAATSLDGRIEGWITEPGVSPPSYAVTEPIDSDLNVDTVVLLCSETARGRVLEFDLYLSEPGPLLPNGADPHSLKDNPSVEIVIDNRPFGADLLFADEYVVVADAADGYQPFLSAGVLDALQNGRTMVLRFDLLREETGQTRRFDSQLTVDLRSGQAAIAAVRRCAAAETVQARR